VGSTNGLVKEILLDLALLQPMKQRGRKAEMGKGARKKLKKKTHQGWRRAEKENTKGRIWKEYHQHSTVGIAALLYEKRVGRAQGVGSVELKEQMGLSEKRVDYGMNLNMLFLIWCL